MAVHRSNIASLFIKERRDITGFSGQKRGVTGWRNSVPYETSRARNVASLLIKEPRVLMEFLHQQRCVTDKISGQNGFHRPERLCHCV